MWAVVALLIVGVAIGCALLAVISQPSGGLDDLDPPIESEDWRRVDAEVVSVLRTGSHVFLLVRFVVGTTLIHADVRYPVAGTVPHAGQRIWIRTDPIAPARVLFDSNPTAAPVTDVVEMAAPGGAARPRSRVGSS